MYVVRMCVWTYVCISNSLADVWRLNFEIQESRDSDEGELVPSLK